MHRPRLFVGSSTEGKKVADTLQLCLEQNVEVTVWHQGVFGLSQGTLESLVKAIKRFDFAVLVLTPDDLTTKRAKRRNSPRDNVIFELGLFMGALGRDRTFMVYCREDDIDLPSDLAGVTAATYGTRSDNNLQAALGPVCTQIENAIKQGFAVLSRIEGWWWSYRNHDQPLGLVRIDADLITNSVKITGDSYSDEGEQVAAWNTLLARVDADGREILYLWEGSHTQPANLSFHGLGRIQFDEPPRAGDPFMSGKGLFWDVDEAHPENTIAKATQLRRVQEKGALITMREGKRDDRRSLIRRKLEEW